MVFPTYTKPFKCRIRSILLHENYGSKSETTNDSNLKMIRDGEAESSVTRWEKITLTLDGAFSTNFLVQYLAAFSYRNGKRFLDSLTTFYREPLFARLTKSTNEQIISKLQNFIYFYTFSYENKLYSFRESFFRQICFKTVKQKFLSPKFRILLVRKSIKNRIKLIQ